MDETDLDAVADRLYALPPEDFTAARDDVAKRAPDKQQRAAVTALRRPTASAHVVNLLARQEPELLQQLLDLGPALADAQRSGEGDALRTLGQQRRALVSAVTATAVGLAGRPVVPQARAEVEQTLEAALADPAAADAVRSGRLVRALSYAGLGEVDVTGAVAVRRPVETAPAVRRAPDLAALEQAALDASAALDDAVRACERAEDLRRTAEQRHDDARTAAEQAATAVQELEEQLAAARAEHEARLGAAQQAERDAAGAARDAERHRQHVSAAQEEAEQARAALDRARRA